MHTDAIRRPPPTHDVHADLSSRDRAGEGKDRSAHVVQPTQNTLPGMTKTLSMQTNWHLKNEYEIIPLTARLFAEVFCNELRLHQTTSTCEGRPRVNI